MSYVVARRIQIRHRLRRRIYITPPLKSQCATKKLTSSASISLLIQLLYFHVYVCTRVVVRRRLALSIIVGSGTLRSYPRKSMVIIMFEWKTYWLGANEVSFGRYVLVRRGHNYLCAIPTSIRRQSPGWLLLGYIRNCNKVSLQDGSCRSPVWRSPRDLRVIGISLEPRMCSGHAIMILARVIDMMSEKCA
jgi:hypothetical protein